jgi:hypothetical protein
MTLRVQCLCFDTADPDRIARFWAAALGWRITDSEPGQFVLEPPAGNLRPEDQAAEVERLAGLGALGCPWARDPR